MVPGSKFVKDQNEQAKLIKLYKHCVTSGNENLFNIDDKTYCTADPFQDEYYNTVGIVRLILKLKQRES